jgi:hypothetical protein
MRRLSLLALVAFVASGRADQFDNYTNPVLAKAISDGTWKEVKELTADQIGDGSGAMTDSGSAFIVVVTNEKRYAKLLAQPARQKFGDAQVGMLLIDKFTTFKGTSERAIQATGQTLHMYPGLRLSLDIGQVVPESVAGDLTVTGEKDAWTLKPLKDAKLFLVTKAIPGLTPKKSPKLVVGEAFETRFFAGNYKLHDDGRRTGVMKLEINEAGDITGTYTSDKDGKEYPVEGKAGTPKHSVSLTIKFPATMQTFTGFMFTGDGKAIAGTTKILEREAGFYAERMEE